MNPTIPHHNCCGTDVPHVHICYLPMAPLGLLGWLFGPDGQAALHGIARAALGWRKR